MHIFFRSDQAKRKKAVDAETSVSRRYRYQRKQEELLDIASIGIHSFKLYTTCDTIVADDKSIDEIPARLKRQEKLQVYLRGKLIAENGEITVAGQWQYLTATDK